MSGPVDRQVVIDSLRSLVWETIDQMKHSRISKASAKRQERAARALAAAAGVELTAEELDDILMT